MSSRPRTIICQSLVRYLPALSGGVGLILVLMTVEQLQLYHVSIGFRNALFKFQNLVDSFGRNNIAVVIILNIFGLPIVANFLRRDVDPHRAMLFRASRVLGWATALLLPWSFMAFISFFGLLVIPPFVILQATRICSIFQRGATVLGALLLSYGSLVVFVCVVIIFICITQSAGLLDLNDILPVGAFLSYAVVAMVLGAELLRSDSEQRRSSTRGAQ